MANLGAEFYLQSEKSDCRWICSSAVQFELSGRESLISQAGVFHCISLWVPENHYSWLEIVFLCFKFSFSPFFFFFLPSLSISEAEQPNVGNYWSLRDTEDFQTVFMFFGTVYIWLISFSRNSWISNHPPSFFSLCSYENQVYCLGGGQGRGWEAEDEFILTLSLFHSPELNSTLLLCGQLVWIIPRERYLWSVCFRQCQILQLLLYSPL